jgi:MurE/MurF fusion protein
VVCGLKSHSRHVSPGDVFYVMGEGFRLDQYLSEVLQKDPSLLVVPEGFEFSVGEIPVRVVSDVRKTYREDCQEHYRELFESFQLWGITGTKGKTTIAWGLYQYLESEGVAAAYIGTLGVSSKNLNRPSINTTPGLSTFIEILKELRALDITHVICEISSQGLVQERVPIPYFQVRAFTDLSEEHLDSHKTMESYFSAKNLFFADHKNSYDSFILDRSKWAARLSIHPSCPPTQFGLQSTSTPSVEGFKTTLEETRIQIKIGAKNLEVTTPWIGFFNAENLLCMISILLDQGFSLHSITKFCSQLSPISGRLEMVSTFRGARIFVDYAHSAQAMEFLLETVRELFVGRLHLIFGCGGERDRAKRPRMAQAARRFADRILITNDNPRQEDPNSIIADILSGFGESKNYEIYPDRREAIREGVKGLSPGDVLLVVGKGHEDYQVIGENRIHFSDHDEIRNVISDFSKHQIQSSLQPIHRLENFLSVSGAKLHHAGQKNEVCGFHFDSRKLLPGECFVAMNGQNLDGHQFAEAAIEKGAGWILGSKKMDLAGESAILEHPSPLQALQAFAAYFRDTLSAVIIGITGSCGKTTTKDCLHALLGENSYANPGNYNNDLGLPISLLKMAPRSEFGIFELGINSPGEMEVLSQCLVPDIALITNINLSHREYFPTRRQLILEKLKIASHMRRDSLLLAPVDLFDEILEVYEPLGYHPRLKRLDYEDFESRFKSHRKFFGEGPYQSFLLACGLARILGVRQDQLESRIPSIELSPLRMEHRKAGKLEVILDCYNAAPISMHSFFSSFDKPEGTILVLADMLELGESTESQHLEVLTAAIEMGFLKVYLLGENFTQAAENFQNSKVEVHSSIDEIVLSVLSIQPQVLGLKGSRVFALERVFEGLMEKEC